MRCSLVLLALAAGAEAFGNARPLRPAGRAARGARTQLDYVPSPVDPNVIYQQLGVIAAAGGAAGFWWTVTVPEKRLELSKSKKAGEVKGLLDELEEAEVTGDRKLERWLLSDWLNPTRRKQPALPFLPKAKFNSGDNPIIAAGALIMAAGVANALGERALDAFN
ncbi:hypothetical protein M885DRAFT_506618 [Pelagophyceae sp. CCMP2097]|nr:hypothetical protein M885DRAFT_506618 [Pelagophyceae sp. CCMP2097]|mmetsp:Transcript_22684/g.76653  ORF Transcript_22684/g.76653 Transcript_22684/m.76653 type:complete len:165 (+) Transcript_22684:196-690(+)